MRHAADNPFCAQRFHALPYRADGVDTAALLAQFWVQGGRGALVGRHGHGKTTLLNALGEHLEIAGHKCVRLTLNTANRVPPRETLSDVCAQTVLLFDGAEQLGAIAWRRLCWRIRHAKGIIITTHRAGRLPTLHTCKTSKALLDELLHELAPGEAHQLRPYAHQLFTTHHGNLREVWFQLYEHCARHRAGAQPHRA